MTLLKGFALALFGPLLLVAALAVADKRRR